MTTASIEYLYIVAKRLERKSPENGGGIHLNSYETRSLIAWLEDNITIGTKTSELANRDYQEGDKEISEELSCH